jgi:hypothetical protein
MLRYRELMVAVLARDRWRVRPSVTAIWVDSPASRDGGRELWRLHGDVKSTPVRARALVRRSRTRWDGLFGGRRPVFGVSLTDCTMRFGATG